MRMWKRCLVVIGVLGVAAVPLRPDAAGAATKNPVFHPPSQYYLALGDSLAFGFQEAKFLGEVGSGTYDPASFNTGYDANFAAALQPFAPGGHSTEVNYGCPGETTGSMVNGGCAFHFGFALHNEYPLAESQLQAAVAFLQAHPHKVNPITLDIGANDLLQLNGSCGGDPGCIVAGLPATIATMEANVDQILTTLHNAAPGAEVIAMNVPDPFEFTAPASLQVFGAYDHGLDGVLAQHKVRLVDAFSFVASLDQATFCALTAVCTPPLFDIHPTDAGYAELAQFFFLASGYGVLQP